MARFETPPNGAPRMSATESKLLDVDLPAGRREPPPAVPISVRRTRLRVKDDDLVLDIPAPGLGARDIVRTLALAAAGAAALVFGARLPTGAVGGAGRLLMGFGGVVLLAVGVYGALRAWLGASSVVVTPDHVEVSHEFPVHRTGQISRAEFCGALIGGHGRIECGYASGDWGSHKSELVLTGGKRALHFGAGLPKAELVWLKQVIEDRLPPNGTTSPERAGDPDEAQPPERFWRDITRYALGALAATVGLLVGLLALGIGGSLVGSVLVLMLLLATVVALSYRSYRLERTGCAWHRAVIKYEAALMDLRFSPGDPALLVDSLPDFKFFGGPRRLYNVAWSEADPGKIVLFDYTSSRRGPMRDGMGCAVTISKLSYEALNLSPRLWPALSAPLWGMRLPEHPALERRYCIEAENEGRARNLLGPEVVNAILSWPGSGPPPQVCIQGGMVGLSMHRRYADSDKILRQFYNYALGIREAILARLRELRA